ncbi:MAG TPA: carbonic anhydrase [Tepidisphaeraceae bacterium]|nr:carbonic anhydrase [Tepidisphaeraceae bacterium]
MFESQTPYEPKRIHAAAIYCSDGRLGEHFDDFLTQGLKLPRYDRLALPGGPAALAEHAATTLEHAAVADELKFLVEVHGLDRVVLIQHQNCAFYTNRLKLSGFNVEQQQRDDLRAAAEFVRKVTGVQHIEAYFARQMEGHIRFEVLEL